MNKRNANFLKDREQREEGPDREGRVSADSQLCRISSEGAETERGEGRKER